MLLSEGLTSGHIYVLAERRIELVRGKTQVAVVSDPGSVFGEMSVLLYTGTYRGAEYNVSFVSKVKIELAIERSTLDRVIEAIRTTGLSGQIGDGKIFIPSNGPCASALVKRVKRPSRGEPDFS